MIRNSNDEGQEVIERAFIYAINRVRDGSIKTEGEARHSFAAFADGFCMASHVDKSHVHL